MIQLVIRTCACVIGFCGIVAFAQEPKKTPNPDIERGRSLWEPQSMMQQACDGISAHYKLDDRQEEFTCNLLTERVTKFLDKHESEFWPLLMQLTEYQVIGKQPDGTTAQTIGRRGSPLFEDAKKEILKAQDDFRQILNEEQKALHDKDLKGLHRQMSSIEQQFQNWSEGKPGLRSPLQGAFGPSGPGGISTVPLRNRLPRDSEWERYVKQFIESYRLDETQKAAALAIWKDLQERAVQYRKGHQQELDEGDKLVRDAQLAKPFDKAKLESAKRFQQTLNKPFEDWFTELKTRLEQIPTEKQRVDYQERVKIRRAGTTQPATTQPAGQPGAPPSQPGSGTPKPAPTTPPPSTQPSAGQQQTKPGSSNPGGR